METLGKTLQTLCDEHGVAAVLFQLRAIVSWKSGRPSDSPEAEKWHEVLSIINHALNVANAAERGEREKS